VAWAWHGHGVSDVAGDDRRRRGARLAKLGSRRIPFLARSGVRDWRVGRWIRRGRLWIPRGDVARRGSHLRFGNRRRWTHDRDAASPNGLIIKRGFPWL